MTRDEKVGVIGGLCLASALLPQSEAILKELAWTLNQRWQFSEAETLRNETLCAELKNDIPQR